MSAAPILNRRSMLKATAASGLVLALGFDRDGKVVAADAPKPDLVGPTVFKTWLEVGRDNVVTFYSPDIECGQGVNTALAMLVAEELDVDWKKLRVLQSGADEIYVSPLSKHVATNSSASVRYRFDQMRQIGAWARECLKQAAANQWKVPVGELTTANSTVTHAASKRRATYGSLTQAAAMLPLPKSVTLRPKEQWKIIGTSMPRLDTTVKSTGQARYGIDYNMPQMLHAAVIRSPIRGSNAKSIDDAAARARKGVKAVENLGYGVAVVATDAWTARRALEDVKVTWEPSRWDTLDSAGLAKLYTDAFAKPGIIAKNDGDVNAAARAPGAKVVEAEYTAQYLHHMCMEPMNSTAWVHDGLCEIWAPTGGASNLVHGIAFLLDMPAEKVIVRRSEFVGGHFGRRDRLDQDMEAVHLSQRMKAPVQVVQRREHDTQVGYYRPYQKTRMKAVVDASGKLVGWDQKIITQSLTHAGHDLSELAFAGFDLAKLQDYLKAGGSPYYANTFDNFAVSLTTLNAAYAIANNHIEVVEMEAPLKPTYWRSVGQSINTPQLECFIDEVAAAAGIDPIEFRKAQMDKAPRGKVILDELAKRIGWKPGQPAGSGTGWGIALSNGFAAYAAIGVQVKVTGKQLRLLRVVCVADQGVTVNRNQSEAQLQSGIVDGLAAACMQEITLQNGAVQQRSWNDYPTMTLALMPQVEVALLDSGASPGSISELSTPLVMPAVANAVYAATGERIRELPLSRHGYQLEGA
jgi:isoquinoline 1-oxidoreductase beta subunit